MRRICLALVLLFCASTARAQPLADSVPADAMIYVSWTGSDSMGKGYEGSHLQSVVQASNMKALIERVIPALSDMASMEDPDAARGLELVTSVFGAIFRYPTAFYLAPIDVTGEEPQVKFALICDAGEATPELAEQLNNVLAEMGPSPVPIRVHTWGERLTLEVGELLPRQQTRLGGPLRIVPAPSLKDHKPFQTAMTQVKGDAALAVYIDVAAFMATIDTVAAKEAANFAQRFPNQHNDAADWPKMRDALGLSGLRRIAITSGFEGKQWSDRLFIDAPGPRKGLAKLLDSKPLTHDLLKLIPRDAAMMGVGQFDFAMVLDEVRSVMDALDPNARQQLEDGLVQVQQQTGVDVENGLFKALGSEWGYYTSSTVAGKGLGGMVMINRPRDAEALQGSLEQIEGMINSIVAMQTAELPIELQIRTMEHAGVTVHYAPLLLASPCWAMHEGTLYVSLYPQALVAAVSRGDKTSILDNAAFAAMWKQIGVTPGAVSWADIEQLAPDAYQGMLMFSSLAEGGASVVGVPTAMVLPTLPELMPHLKPAATFAWSDDAGFHMRSVSSFPGAAMFASQAGSVMSQQMMAVMTVLPDLLRSQQQQAMAFEDFGMAEDVDLRQQAHQVVMGLAMYAADNNGKYPASLADPTFMQYVQPEMLRHPLVSDEPMPAKMTEEWHADFGAFVYVGHLKPNRANMREDDRTILAYEHSGWISGDLATVMYADGVVERIDLERINANLVRQVGKTIGELEGWEEAEVEGGPMNPPPAP